MQDCLKILIKKKWNKKVIFITLKIIPKFIQLNIYIYKIIHYNKILKE